MKMRHVFRAKAVCYQLMLCQEQNITVGTKQKILSRLKMYKHECIKRDLMK